MQIGTNYLLRIVLIVGLFFLQHLQIFACDLCGCFIGVLPYDNQSSIGLTHRYRIYSGYPGSSGGMLFPQGAYRLSTPSVLHGTGPSVISPDDFESYKVFELRGKWFIHPRVELNFVLPFSENREMKNGERERIDGLGDASFLVAYHLIRKTGDGNYRHRLVAGIGIKIPSGNCSSIASDGDRLSLMIQNGTGSTDGLAYVGYIGGGHNFRWGTTYSAKINGTNKYDEQFSPSFSGNAFVGYLLTSNNWKFLPQASLYQEFTGGLYQGNVLIAGTRMSGVLAGPAMDIYYKNLALNCGIQFPVYENEMQYNLLNKGKLFLGLTWSFNQKNFLLNSNKKS